MARPSRGRPGSDLPYQPAGAPAGGARSRDVGKLIVAVVLAALVGGGAVYGVMRYLDSDNEPPVIQTAIVTPTPSPTSTAIPTDTPMPAVLLLEPTNTPVPTAVPTPTSTPVPVATATPTIEPPSELEVVVNAFATCDGQYTGRDREFRAYAAETGIADGRQSVADIRDLVELHCNGVFPDLMPSVVSRAHEPTRTPVPTATIPPTPIPTAIPEGAVAVSPHLKHADEKRYMLELINIERRKAGVGEVTLGDNIAAQLHADSSLANCTSGHWGLDGLKPYMRYSLAGGYQSNGENGSGLDYCIKASDYYTPNEDAQTEIRETMAGWMRSPGHRRNLLDPWHKKVNIGLAWDRYNTAMYQHFEGDYVTYDVAPRIVDGMLTFSGTTHNGVQFGKKRDLGVQIYYDPPPRELTRGQVSRTYCYSYGMLVAGLREPLTGRYFWPNDEFEITRQPCPDPNNVSPELPGPRSYREAH